MARTLDLRTRRIEKQIRQRDLAEQVQASLTDLMRWERGLELPPKHYLSKLARSLDCSPEVLLRHQQRYIEAATPGEGYTTRLQSTNGVHNRLHKPVRHKYKVLDLFCGSGGFSYGFELTGKFQVTAGIDLLSDRVETFTRNHPYADAILADIRSFSIEHLGNHAQNPDIIIGGPPCQGFSSIRPFRDCTESDPRNNLFEHFALTVSILRPRWFVLENVVGLLTHTDGRSLPAFISVLEEAGYTCDWRVLNAAHFGLPQNRERVVVVGSREGRTFEWPRPTHYTEHRSMAGNGARRTHVDPLFSQGLPLAVTVMEAIHDLPPVRAGEEATDYGKPTDLTSYETAMREGSQALTLHQATAHTERMLEIIRRAGSNRAALPKGLATSGFSSCYSRLDPDKPSVTLTVNFVHPASNKCIHPCQDRALTPREGARLQGFPDRFEFAGSRTEIVKQIGNAVPPLLGKAIAQAIASQW